jgi:hypothetical protein
MGSLMAEPIESIVQLPTVFVRLSFVGDQRRIFPHLFYRAACLCCVYAVRVSCILPLSLLFCCIKVQIAITQLGHESVMLRA